MKIHIYKKKISLSKYLNICEKETKDKNNDPKNKSYSEMFQTISKTERPKKQTSN